MIVGAAKLDLVLFQVLQRVLAPCTSSVDDLLENSGGLSTFSSRIHLVYRLGLIDDHYARALHLVRKIRNTFAHEAAKGSLDQPPHRDRIRELAAPFLPYDRFNQDAATMAGSGIASKQFRHVLAIMIARLEQLLVSSVQCHPAISQTLVPPHWDAPTK
ncbi:MAG: hypothetical protein IPG05_12595 [Gemmatimonadetes bacterium]|nr:hypothetical protein [Gemmatimonadota bacterium]